MNWHPNIYKLNLVLIPFNVLGLVLCVGGGSTLGIVVNAATLLVNVAGAALNYSIRERRRQLQRENLIELTVGKE